MPLPPVTSGLQFWYDAADIIGVVDGQTITSWADSSVNSRTATLQTGTATYRTNRHLTKPAVTFASVAMSVGGSAIASNGAQNTVVAIFAQTSTSGRASITGGIGPYNQCCGLWTNVSAAGPAVLLNIGNDTNGAVNNAENVRFSGTASPDTNWHIAILAYQPPGYSPDNRSLNRIRLDAADDTVTHVQSISQVVTPPTYIGADSPWLSLLYSNFFAGELQVIGYYNRMLTLDEIRQIEGYPYTIPPPASEVRGNIDWDQVGLDARHGPTFGRLVQYSDGRGSAGNVPVFMEDGALTDSGVATSYLGALSAAPNPIFVNSASTVQINGADASFDNTVLVNGA